MFLMDLKRGSRAQIWVETVIYTLIGLTIMAIIIGVVTPKINEMTDKTILTQTMETLTKLNEQIQDALSASGSQREISLTVKRGSYFIDGQNDVIYFLLKGTNALISQPGEPIKNGDLTVLTQERASKKYDVYLILNYSSSSNITYNNKDMNKTFTAAPSAYRMLIINRGSPSQTTPKQIDIQSIGGG
jgi:type II secretory pathway pseudopilin PulG